MTTTRSPQLDEFQAARQLLTQKSLARWGNSWSAELEKLLISRDMPCFAELNTSQLRIMAALVKGEIDA